LPKVLPPKVGLSLGEVILLVLANGLMTMFVIPVITGVAQLPKARKLY
jgi:hypothetical protein